MKNVTTEAICHLSVNLWQCSFSDIAVTTFCVSELQQINHKPSCILHISIVTCVIISRLVSLNQVFYLFIFIYCCPAHPFLFTSALTISGEHYKCNFPQHLVTSTIKSIVTILPFCKNITIIYHWEFVAHFRVHRDRDVYIYIFCVSVKNA